MYICIWYGINCVVIYEYGIWYMVYGINKISKSKRILAIYNDIYRYIFHLWVRSNIYNIEIIMYKILI